MLRFIKVFINPYSGIIEHVIEAGTPIGENGNDINPGAPEKPSAALPEQAWIIKQLSLNTDVVDTSPHCPCARDYLHILECPNPTSKTARLQIKQNISDNDARAKAARIVEIYDYDEAVQALETARAALEQERLDRIAANRAERLRLVQPVASTAAIDN